MYTYRDMTFCINKDCEKECSRRLTPEIILQARKYKVAISYADFKCEDKDNESNV